MDHRGLAEVVSSCATGLAVIAVLGALFIAVVGFPQGRGPPFVVYLAAVGVILFLFGHALRYLVGG